MCTTFIIAPFCLDVPPPLANRPTRVTILPAPTLHRLYLAPYPLQRICHTLRSPLPLSPRGSLPRRSQIIRSPPFISVFIIASEVIDGDTYWNKSCCIIGPGMFSLRKVNQMEREMCSYLESLLNVKPEVQTEVKTSAV